MNCFAYNMEVKEAVSKDLINSQIELVEILL